MDEDRNGKKKMQKEGSEVAREGGRVCGWKKLKQEDLHRSRREKEQR